MYSTLRGKALRAVDTQNLTLAQAGKAMLHTWGDRDPRAQVYVVQLAVLLATPAGDVSQFRLLVIIPIKEAPLWLVEVERRIGRGGRWREAIAIKALAIETAILDYLNSCWCR